MRVGFVGLGLMGSAMTHNISLLRQFGVIARLMLGASRRQAGVAGRPVASVSEEIGGVAEHDGRSCRTR
jgi:3-hydroxyisobutyrate dehydrogenase-like beta-hydroxyacid dehydrogenase